MQTRRDLLQAHRLMTQRAALALLQAEPDPPDQPLRRLNVGLISSVLVAVIVAAAFGVWGLLGARARAGPDAPGTLIIDSQTGTSYIWCEHGKLCPVVNYASARLALGTSTPDQRTVDPGVAGPVPARPDDRHSRPARAAAGPGHAGRPALVGVRADGHQPGHAAAQTTTTVVGGRRVGGRPMTGNGRCWWPRAARTGCSGTGSGCRSRAACSRTC